MRFFNRPGTDHIIGEPQSAQTKHARLHGLAPFSPGNQTVASQTLQAQRGDKTFKYLEKENHKDFSDHAVACKKCFTQPPSIPKTLSRKAQKNNLDGTFLSLLPSMGAVGRIRRAGWKEKDLTGSEQREDKVKYSYF